MTNEQKIWAYYQAASAQHSGHSEAPPYVPSRVRLKKPVRGDFPFGAHCIAAPGDHDCDANKWGAVSVKAENGQTLGLRPAEYEPLKWRENAEAQR